MTNLALRFTAALALAASLLAAAPEAASVAQTATKTGWTSTNIDSRGPDVINAIAVQSDGKILVAGHSGSATLARYNANGSLDTTFGTNGVTTNRSQELSAVALQADGKIVVATGYFNVYRFNANGSPDTTFRMGGLSTAIRNLSTTGNDGLLDVALQSDGKIVVAGEIEGDFFVARLNANGSLDTTFDTDGITTTNTATARRHFPSNGAHAVTVQSDGKIVAAGRGDDDFVVVRYNTNGSLDTTFDTDGITTTNTGTSRDGAHAVAVQSDGNIVAAGVSQGDFAMVRYTTDGSLDTTFDTDGITTTNTAQSFIASGARAVTVQSNGKIVAVGGGDRAIVVVRYNTDGSLDTTFDTDGITTTTSVSGDDSVEGNAMALQSDGKIVAAGALDGDFAMVRYNTDGSLDTTFDTDGITTTNINPESYDFATAMALQSDGKIVVAGEYRTGGAAGGRLALVRYNTDGSLDTTFDTDGITTTNTAGPFRIYGVGGVAVQSDDKIVVAAGAGDWVVARYSSNGSLDTTFDTDGITTTDIDRIGVGTESADAVAVQSDGRIIVAGSSKGDFAMVRYNTDGSLDTTFDTDGITTTNTVGSSLGHGARAVAVQSDGKIVAAGTSDGDDFVVVRYNIDGSLDTTFDTDGITTTDIGTSSADGAFAVAVQSDGKIVAAGISDGDFAMVRYNIDGSLDITFDTDGIATIDTAATSLSMVQQIYAIHDVTVQSDGKIVAFGRAHGTSIAGLTDYRDGLIVRFTANGSLDTTFDTDGIATTEIRQEQSSFFTSPVLSRMGRQFDGKFVLVGSSQLPNDFAVARFNADGSLDTTFGDDAGPPPPPVPPVAPSGVSAVPDDRSAVVSWTEPASDGGAPITAYTVTASPGGRTCSTSGATFCTVLGLTNGTPYTFTVTARNRAGTSPASQPSAPAAPLAVPGPPTRVRATPDDRSATVSWTEPASDGGFPVTSYTVTASPDGQSCTTTGTTTCAVTGLDNGTPYTFTVTARNEAGPSQPSSRSVAVKPRRVPDAPTQVMATPAEDGQSRVSWQASVSDGGAPIAGYEAVSDPDGLTCSASGPEADACTLTGLTNGTHYGFTVTARNEAGPSAPSEPSSSVRPAGAPEPPVGVAAVPGSGPDLEVRWTAPANTGGPPIVRYEATASPGRKSCNTRAATTCTIFGLVRGRSYEITVTAENEESRLSAASKRFVAAVPADRPDPPHIVDVHSGNGNAAVSWSAPSSTGAPDATIVEYRAEAAEAGEAATSSCTAVGDGLSCILLGLANGTVYHVVVTAESSYGLVSEPSLARTASPLVNAGAPVAPTGVTASLQGDTAEVSWSAPSTLSSDPPGGSDQPGRVLVWLAAPALNAGAPRLQVDPVTGYDVHASPGPGSCDAVADATSCTITGLAGGNAYTFTVIANSDAGPSTASEPSAERTVTAAAPGAPAAVDATPGGDWAVITWEAPTSDGGAAITGYTATATSAPRHRTCRTAGAGRSCVVRGLDNGSHTFTVTARNPRGASAPSQPSAEIWITAPTGVQAEPGEPGAGEVTVKWAVPDTSASPVTITGYTVTSSPGQRTCIAAAAVTTCTVSGLVQSRAYTFTVTAQRSDGLDAASARSNRTTPTARQRPTPGGGGGGGGGGGPEPEPEPEPEPVSFSDVAQDSWHAPHIAHIARLGITTGYPDGTFRPSQHVTRAQMAAFLARALKLDTDQTPTGRFDDVPTDAWYAPHAERIAKLRITIGCSTDPPLYCPTQPVTRSQMALFLLRAFDLPTADTDRSAFRDVPTDHNAHQAIQALKAAQITTGCGTDPPLYCPTQPVTRGQMAAFLSRAINHSTNKRT